MEIHAFFINSINDEIIMYDFVMDNKECRYFPIYPVGYTKVFDPKKKEGTFDTYKDQIIALVKSNFSITVHTSNEEQLKTVNFIKKVHG